MSTKRVSYEGVVAKIDTALRVIKGPLLRPGIRDRQGSMISADVIRVAAHDYMVGYRKAETTTGFMHNDFEKADERFPLLESWITDVEMVIPRTERMLVKGETGDGDIVVPAGSWMVAIKVNDDKAWKAVLAGTLKGFSIGGWAKVIPTDADGNVLQEAA